MGYMPAVAFDLSLAMRKEEFESSRLMDFKSGFVRVRPACSRNRWG
jgi:hypothetical protein